MKQPPKFHQVLRAVIKRANARHRQVTNTPLSLHTIAQDVGLDITTFILALRGEAILEHAYLFPLLIYLGCDEQEQRFIFHLAEIAARESYTRTEPSTEGYALKLFQPRDDTDPEADRITDEHPRL